MVAQLTIGSLFSGIGGLELGLEWSGLGPTLWQIEIDEKLRNCLATHWPDAERHSDIANVRGADLPAVDLICGGFPCQDISSAGKRAGLSGARSGLWSEFRRIVDERRPRWVCVENVASGATKWVDAIRSELEELGYASLPIPLGADDCGAWHRRKRVFVVAYAHGFRLRVESRGTARENWKGSTFSKPPTGWTAAAAVHAVVYGLPGRLDEQRALGNSVVPQCAEVVGYVIGMLDRLLEAE